MNLALRPATLAALEHFRVRRSRLLWLRALFCLLAIVVVSLLAVALLDRAWFMPEIIRPWVSVSIYIGGLIAAWRVALRFLGVARSQTGAAELIEAAEPALHERLLAAVELAETGSTDRVKDSPEFRARLQDDVADAVAGLNYNKALPARSVGGWLAVLLLGIAAAVALMFVPSLHLPGFLARAALPFANLARPSSVKIDIVRPAPKDTVVPFASEMNIAADITGGPPDKVFLETSSTDGKTRRVELSHVTGSRFEGSIAIGQTDVQYRVSALDCITPWHMLVAMARPRVVEFAKEIVPPAYAGMQPAKLTEDHGDIEALEGSTVKLVMKTNQPVSKAELVLNPDQTTHPAPTPAKTNAPDQIAADLAVEVKNASWQIALTSAETGFTNEESTPWRVTAIPDLPPTAQITEPKEQAELLPDEALRLGGTATDDIGLASVKLAHAINGANWKETEIAAKPGKEANVQHLFAMAPLGVKAGDAVLLKLVAVDLKGQKAESEPLRIIILEQTIDPRQRQWAEDQRRLAKQAEQLSEKTRDMRNAMNQVKKNAKVEKRDPNKADATENSLAKAQSELEQVKEQADDLWKQLKETARNAPNQLDANEAQMLGEKLAQLRRETIPELEKRSEEPVESPELLQKAASAANNQADQLANAARAFAKEDTAKIAAQAAQQLHRQENLLTENSLQANRDAAARPKWQEQQRAAIAATESVKKDIAALQEQTRNGGEQKQLEQLKQQVSEAAQDLNSSLDKPEQNKSPEHLYGAADNLRQRLGRTAEAARAMQEQAANEAAKARQQLQAQDNPAMIALEEAKAALNEAVAQQKNPKQREKPTRDGLTKEERAEKNLTAAAKQLQDQAELREQNSETNDQQALDMNRASRAADKLANQTKEAGSKPTAEALDKALAETKQLADVTRTLDADALAQDAVKALDSAASADPIAQKTDPAQQAAQARAAEEQLKALPQALRRANQPNELATAAQQAADSARNAAENLKNAARDAATKPPGQQQPVNQQPTADAQAKAAQVAQQIAPKAEEARQALAALTPSLSEMMKSVAEDLKGTQQDTQTAANDAKAEKPVDEVAQKAQALRPEAAENAEKMDSLQAALRQEANAKDLAQAEQRQMARSADVALAQMQQKSPQIAQNLKQAAQATQSQPQAQSLQKAADAQQQTAEALNQLAQNFQKMEQGQQLTAEDQQAMSQLEQQLAVQEPLDEAYDRAEELAKLAKDAQADPAAVLQALEKELPKNPSMQKSLADIGKTTAQTAEKQVNEKAAQPAMLSMAAEFAAHDLARVARHQQRLGDKESAQQTAKASNDLQQTSVAAKDPSKASPQMAQQAQANATQAAKAAEQTAANAPPAAMTSPIEQAQGMMLAQALDQLDKTLHPMSQAPGAQHQEQSQQQQQSAQQNLNDAQQNQQQQMADARNQGQVPGQKPGQQQAQNKPPQEQGQQSEEGGNFSTQLKDGVLGADAILVNGDWGHLPTRMASDLTEATRQEAPPEYRAAIESYYKAIATKARK